MDILSLPPACRNAVHSYAPTMNISPWHQCTVHPVLTYPESPFTSHLLACPLTDCLSDLCIPLCSKFSPWNHYLCLVHIPLDTFNCVASIFPDIDKEPLRFETFPCFWYPWPPNKKLDRIKFEINFKSSQRLVVETKKQ